MFSIQQHKNIRNPIRPKFKCRACQSETNIYLICHRYKIVRLDQPKQGINLDLKQQMS